MKVKYQLVISILLVFVAGSPVSADLLVGWDEWTSGDEVANLNGLGATGLAEEVGDWRENTEAASNDGTFGSLAGASMDNLEAAKSGTMIGVTSDDGAYDFTVTAGFNSLVLETFHFDARRKRAGSPEIWTLTTLAGAIETGIQIGGGSLSNTLGAVGPSDHDDFDLDLRGLLDNVLDPGESATFRLSFSGGTGSGTSNDQKTYLDNVAISGTNTVPPPFELIAGWENWASTGVRDPSQTDGITTGTTSASGFSLDTDKRAQTDGTWGSLDTPVADMTTESNNDSVRITNGGNGFYEFTITDTGGADRELAFFHFDTATFRPNSARSWELSVVSGDLTAGSVNSGQVPSGTAQQQDWTDLNIPLAGLDDNILDANGSVTFRLEFSGGTGSGGHHQSLDNVAVSAFVTATDGLAGDFNGDEVVDLADYTIWRNNLGATKDGSVLNGNGSASPTVDASDYGLWKANFGAPASGLDQAAARVPEPGASILAIASAIALLVARRRC